MSREPRSIHSGKYNVSRTPGNSNFHTRPKRFRSITQRSKVSSPTSTTNVSSNLKTPLLPSNSKNSKKNTRTAKQKFSNFFSPVVRFTKKIGKAYNNYTQKKSSSKSGSYNLLENPPKLTTNQELKILLSNTTERFATEKNERLRELYPELKNSKAKQYTPEELSRREQIRSELNSLLPHNLDERRRVLGNTEAELYEKYYNTPGLSKWTENNLGDSRNSRNTNKLEQILKAVKEQRKVQDLTNIFKGVSREAIADGIYSATRELHKTEHALPEGTLDKLGLISWYTGPNLSTEKNSNQLGKEQIEHLSTLSQTQLNTALHFILDSQKRRGKK